MWGGIAGREVLSDENMLERPVAEDTEEYMLDWSIDRLPLGGESEVYVVFPCPLFIVLTVLCLPGWGLSLDVRVCGPWGGGRGPVGCEDPLIEAEPDCESLPVIYDCGCLVGSQAGYWWKSPPPLFK